MRLPRKFLKFDYYIHALFGLVMFSMLFMIPYTIYLLIYAFALLSIWQVLSALILGLGYSDRKRIYYLCAVAVFIIIIMLLQHYYSLYALLAFMALALNAWYGVLTYKDATYRTPSFWDLEF